MSRESDLISFGRERFEEIGKKIRRDSDALRLLDQMGGGGGGGEGTRRLGSPGNLNTVTPCAACKLLRRRCGQKCPFSPYFSPHEPQKFASVHKVFGASNVSKMLMEVPESERADAAYSLVYEANIRIKDPIYGSMGVISALQQQVQDLQTELNAVKAEVLKYKYRETRTSHVTLLPSREISNVAPLSPPHHSLPLMPTSSSIMYTPVTSTTAAEFSTIANNHKDINYFS